MGKIHHDSKHPHQDGEVPHMGKGPQMSHNIQKEKEPNKAASMHTEDTTFEADIPTGQRFGYPPQVFTDPTHTVVMTHTESEDAVKQETKFLGRYCKYCHKCGETWCFSSNWEDELLNVDNPNSNSSVETIPSPTANRPPVGWSKIRCTIIRKKDQTRPPSQTAEVSQPIVALACNKSLQCNLIENSIVRIVYVVFYSFIHIQ